MVHEGRAEDGARGDLDWSPSGSTTGSGAWSVGNDEVGEKAGVDVDLESMDSCRRGSSCCGMGLMVVASTTVGGSTGCAGGGGARCGTVHGGSCGRAQVVVQLWSRSMCTTAG